MDTSSYSDNDSVVQELSTGQHEEGKVSDLEQDISITDTGQTSTEEQNYRETMHGVCSYRGWTHIQDMDTHTTSAEECGQQFFCTQTTTSG